MVRFVNDGTGTSDGQAGPTGTVERWMAPPADQTEVNQWAGSRGAFVFGIPVFASDPADDGSFGVEPIGAFHGAAH